MQTNSVQSDGQNASPPVTPGGALSGARILVVEDEFLIGMQLQAVFEEEGAEVIGPCATLAEALERAREGDITGATLDFNLGKQLVTPVAELLTQRRVPFLFYSVKTTHSALDPWRHLPLVQKPAAPDELVRTLASLLKLA
ncbi:DNA-binding response OmpR family regulator [Rhizomicrobium palustre]|uniref:DNA-binding response OmpR family regulator n=1 Tax=Rhizomicrobium palustre TaxID=189966 RepID=A0A846N369_9PROT|nr:response regulator [Rhizomicrobium palustre]NIK89959.1 DNA-binding response OmpR family regulator [Rhizomicrobium palustre]